MDPISKRTPAGSSCSPAERREPFGPGRRLRDMHLRPLAALIAALLLAAGCGQATGGGSSQAPPPSTPGNVTISGLLLATTSAHPNGGSPQGGVKIGVYTRPISNGGPVMLDPPDPVATVMTGSDGRFTVELPGARSRYFVSAIDAHGYAPGRWARPDAPVRLVACTDCAIPL